MRDGERRQKHVVGSAAHWRKQRQTVANIERRLLRAHPPGKRQWLLRLLGEASEKLVTRALTK